MPADSIQLPLNDDVGLLTMPSEILVEIANNIDDWRDFQAFTQVCRRTRQTVSFKMTHFKKFWVEEPASLIAIFGQRLMECHHWAIVADIRYLCGIDPRKATGYCNYGEKYLKKDTVTGEQNGIWFRNMACLCRALRRTPVSKLHTLFEIQIFRSQHIENRLLLRCLSARTPLGLITFVRNLLLSSERMNRLAPIRLRLGDLLASMAVVFGNGFRRGRYNVVVDCDRHTDPEGRSFKPVFEWPEHSMDGLVLREMGRLDLLFLAQYYRLFARLLSLDYSLYRIGEWNPERTLHPETRDLIVETENIWGRVRRLVSTWEDLDEAEDRGEPSPLRVAQIGDRLL